MANQTHCFGPFEATIIAIRPRNLNELLSTGKASDFFQGYREFLAKAAAIVEAHEGVFFNLEDGSIMAAWGLEGARPDDALNAVAACLALREDLTKFNRARAATSNDPLIFGFGLESGKVIVTSHSLGDGREALAVMGDAVSGANAIEALTPDLRTDVLISSKVAAVVAKDFMFEGVGGHEELQYVSGIFDEGGNAVRISTVYKPSKTLAAPVADSDNTPPHGIELPAGEGNFIDPEILNQASLPGHWFVKVEGDVRGPLSRDEIVVALRTGELSAETFACADLNSPSWGPLGDLEELRDVFAPKAA